MQEQPGKGKPGSEQQLCTRQISRRVACAVTQASERQAPCLPRSQEGMRIMPQYSGEQQALVLVPEEDS